MHLLSISTLPKYPALTKTLCTKSPITPGSTYIQTISRYTHNGVAESALSSQPIQDDIQVQN